MKKIVLIFTIFILSASCFAKDVLTGKIESADFLVGANDFVIAIVKGEDKKVEEYLKLGANPNEKYSRLPVIFFSAHLRYDNIMKMLLEYGADPNSTTFGEDVLKYSIYRKCTKCAINLIEYGADVNRKSFGTSSALNLALELEDMETASALLRAGATPNKKSFKLMKKLEY